MLRYKNQSESTHDIARDNYRKHKFTEFTPPTNNLVDVKARVLSFDISNL